MELIEGKTLYNYIKSNPKLSEQEIFIFFEQIYKGLSSLHAMGIMHRDIKPDNILVHKAENNVNIKICDFGLAEFFSGGRKAYQKCGTPGFMAPEILNSLPYNETVDVYSLGVILYIL